MLLYFTEMNSRYFLFFERSEKDNNSRVDCGEIKIRFSVNTYIIYILLHYLWFYILRVASCELGHLYPIF